MGKPRLLLRARAIGVSFPDPMADLGTRLRQVVDTHANEDLRTYTHVSSAPWHVHARIRSCHKRLDHPLYDGSCNWFKKQQHFTCKMSSRKNVQQSPTEVGVATDPSPEVFAAAGGGGLPDVLKLAVCAGSGVVFGFAAEKGRGKDCH